MGEVDSSLQVYAMKGDWDACLKQVEKEGEQHVEKDTMLYALDSLSQDLSRIGEMISKFGSNVVVRD